MKYFLQDSSYQWIEVVESVYNNPPDNMINNKVRMDPDALVHAELANVMLHDLFALCELLRNNLTPPTFVRGIVTGGFEVVS